LQKARLELATPGKTRKAVRYVTSPTIEDMRRVLDPSDPAPLVLDIETTPAGDIWCCGVTRRSHEAYCFPWIAPFIGGIRDALRGASRVVAHNAAFDLPRLAAALGRGVTGVDAVTMGGWFDTMAAHALVEPDHPHSLAHLGSVYTDLLPWKEDRGDSKETYNCKDVDVTARALRALQQEMDDEGLAGLYERAVGPLMPVLCEMTRVGIAVDRDRMRVVHRQVSRVAKVWQARLDSVVSALPSRQRAIDALLEAADRDESQAKGLDVKGTKREARKLKTAARRARAAAEVLKQININSPKAMRQLLYEDLELPVQRKDGEVTTNDDALAELIRRTGHPALQPVRELRELLKLRGTYLEYETDVLHTELLAHGTGTGRLSSRSPNLQNIPQRSDWAVKVRSIFVPRPGCVFVEVDYSQIERRIQAWDSGDPALLGAYEAGVDTHRLAAAHIYGCRIEEVTELQRYLTKRAVYGESYGMGYLKFSKTLATEGVFVSPAEAKRLLAGLSSAYPVLHRRQEQLVRLANAEHKLRNCFGRLRYFFGDAYGNAMNFIPQSTAADVIISKMVRLARELPGGGRMVMQVHDSLLLETPREEEERVVECARDVMMSPVEEMGGWICPIDVKRSGRNWSFKEA
jgi:DNA polymerase I-like protein with 3'-5' exonuclease and polymerase domains